LKRTYSPRNIPTGRKYGVRKSRIVRVTLSDGSKKIVRVPSKRSVEALRRYAEQGHVAMATA